jgi:hypothetical protein
MDRLLDAIEDIKEKITDAEYLTIMNELQFLYNQNQLIKNNQVNNNHITSRVADNQERNIYRPTILPNITVSETNNNRHAILTLTLTT